MQKLLIVSKPRKDENIFSYINTLTNDNIYETTSWIFNASNITHSYGPRNFLPWRHNFEHFSDLIGLPIEEILKTTFYYEFGYEEEKYEHINYLLYQECLMGKKSKICPKCLEEFEGLKKVWDIRFFLVCPIHKCLLISQCNNCGKSIPYYRKKFYQCKCGADYRKYKITEVSSESSLTFPKLVYSKLFDGTFSEEKIVNILANLSLKDILLIYAFFIKLYYRDKFKAGSVAIPYDPSNLEIFKLISEISEIFLEWPNNYYRFLKNYESAHKSKPKYDRGSLTNHYGYFYIDLYNKFNHPSFDFVREEFEEYLYKNWDKTLISNIRYFKKDLNKAKYMSITQAGKILNIKHARIKKLIDLGYLEAKVTSERNPYILISADSVKKYRSNQKFFVTQKKICALLNINLSTVKSLEQRKILNPMNSSIEGDKSNPIYDSRKVHQIIEIIEKRYKRNTIRVSNSSLSAFESTSINNSVKYVVGANLTTIIELVIKGVISPVGKVDSEKGLKKYMLSIKEVQKEVYINKIKEKNGVFSLRETSQYLNLGEKKIQRFISKGLLRTSTKMKKPFILVEDVIQFKSRYIYLSELSHLCKVDIKSLLMYLNNMNIIPVIDNKIKIINKLYCIEDVMFLINDKN